MGRIIGGFVALLIGLGLLWGAYATLQSAREYKAAATSTEGTVVDFATSRSDGKTMYSPVVEFITEDGKTVQITGSTSSSSPGYDRGDTVPVLYKPDTPESARIDSFMDNWFLPLLLSIFGVIVTLIGAALFFGGIKKQRVEKWLKVHGTKVQAQLQGVELNTSLKVNGKSPWRIAAQWQHPTTSKIYIFHSENIWFDPTPFVKGESIGALVNYNEPREYKLDISFLPEKG